MVNRFYKTEGMSHSFLFLCSYIKLYGRITEKRKWISKIRSTVPEDQWLKLIFKDYKICSTVMLVALFAQYLGIFLHSFNIFGSIIVCCYHYWDGIELFTRYMIASNSFMNAMESFLTLEQLFKSCSTRSFHFVDYIDISSLGLTPMDKHLVRDLLQSHWSKRRHSE